MSFSFGTPSSAATSLSGGFSFAANKPATPAFGLTTGTTQPTSLFGTPNTSTPSFGAPTQTGSAFGAVTATPAFGATATPAFGATSSVAPSFGAPAAAIPNFGAGTTATPSFGATSTSAFGATTSVTPAFGSLISSAPSFGTPTFGSTTPAFGAATASAATGLSFGAATSAPTLGGLGFNAATSTTTATGGLGGLGGFNFLSAPAATAATTTQSFSFSGGLLGSAPTTTTAAAPSLGLGGVEAPGFANAAKTGANGSNSTGAADQQPRNTKLPNEVLQKVESFKNFVKKQKSLSSDVMRASVKPLHKVHSTCESLRREASALSASIRGTRTQSRRLRAAGVRALAAAEGAQRTHDTPPGLQYDNETPPAYVVELISELESQLLTFRKQIEVADKQMQATPKALTEQDLTLGMKRIHDSFIALAGRLQAVHAQVEAHKGQYLSLRRHLLKDTTDVFEERGSSGGADLSNFERILKDAEDTRNLTTLIGIGDVSNTSAVLADPRVALSARHRLTGPTPFQYLGASGFGGIPLNAMPAKQPSTGLGSSWSQTPQTNLGLSMNTSTFGPTPALQRLPGVYTGSLPVAETAKAGETLMEGS